MRSDFHDVFKDAYDYWIDDACAHRYHASKSLALQVWNHRQTEVDELQKRVDALEKAEFKLAQIRAILENNPKLIESLLVKRLEQALKGGCDEAN